MAEKVISAYIDRLDEGKAILLVGDDADDMEKLVMPESLLPKGAKEGIYLTIGISVDGKKTAEAEEEALSLLDC